MPGRGVGRQAKSAQVVTLACAARGGEMRAPRALRDAGAPRWRSTADVGGATTSADASAVHRRSALPHRDARPRRGSVAKFAIGIVATVAAPSAPARMLNHDAIPA